MQASKTSAFVLLLAIVSSQQALGQAADAQTSPEERACTRDVQKFCKDAVPNHALVLQCLQAHGDQLRAPCHKVLVENHRL
jgi:Cysteine rich repeat